MMNWAHVLASRSSRMKASEIRELLKLLDQPDIISFAGGIPDPALFPADDGGAYLAPQILVNVDHSMRVMMEESFQSTRQVYLPRMSAKPAAIMSWGALASTSRSAMIA